MPNMPAKASVKARLKGRRCVRCKKPIRAGASWTAHHRNGRHADNSAGNVVVYHTKCHTEHHQPWNVPKSKEGMKSLAKAARKTKPWKFSPNGKKRKK